MTGGVDGERRVQARLEEDAAVAVLDENMSVGLPRASPSRACEADAGLHDLADLLDDPGEHVECAPTTATWLRRRALSPCLSF